jgi:hypothetical protein
LRTDDLTTQLQEIDAACDDEDAALNAALDALRSDLHTHIPGIIDSYNQSAQTVTVYPAIMRVFRDKGPVALPKLVDVPVGFPGGGDFALTFPVKRGDECLLHFSEKCLDSWWKRGGVQPPACYRTHDLSDAFAELGYRSKPRAISDASTTAVELRSLSNASKVCIDNGGNVTVNATGAVKVAASGNANIIGGMVCLNTSAALPPVPALPDLVKKTLPFTVPAGGAANGVVLASDFCAFTGMPHGAHGCGSSTVVAGK